jgi:hypothetical protein
MRTDDLIDVLAKGAGPRAAPPGLRLLVGVGLGALASVILFALEFGLRPDVFYALRYFDFATKMLIVAALLAAAAPVVGALARPGARVPGHGLSAVAAGLAVLVVVELASTPPAGWMQRLVGSNSAACLVSIPLLSLAPLIGALLALRGAAPTRPALAGAAAGLLAGCVGAVLYGLHCSDDSPLFVAVWYGLALSATALLGALAGRRLLRW